MMGHDETAFPSEKHVPIGIHRFMGDKCNVSFLPASCCASPDAVMIVCSAAGAAEAPQLLCSLLEGAIHVIFKEIVELLALPSCRKEIIFFIRDRGGQRFIFASRLFTSLMFFFGGGGPVF